MKEIEIQLIPELIEFYKLYLKGYNLDRIEKKAKELYGSMPSEALVHEVVMNAYGALFDIAYPYVNSGIKPPTKEEAEKIIEKLEKRLKEI